MTKRSVGHAPLALCVLLATACGEGSSHPGRTGPSLPHYEPDDRRFDLTWAVTPDKVPPALSGGTLAVTPVGLVVAADSDRDQVYLIDPERGALHTVALAAGDEPGRVVATAELAFVALRGAGAVARIDLASRAVTRTLTCSAPRGLALSGSDAVLAACASGELVTLGLDGSEQRRLFVAPDIRDVGVDDAGVWVSRYRSPALLRLAADGALLAEQRPARFAFESGTGRGAEQTFAPTLAARTISSPHGPIMLHQRAQTTPVLIELGGYGGGEGLGCDAGVVHATLTRFGAEASAPPHAILRGSVVPTDVALSPSGARLAVVSPGGLSRQRAPFPQSGEFGEGRSGALGPTRQLAILDSSALVPVPTTESDPQVSTSPAEPCLEGAVQAEHVFPGEAVAVAFVGETRFVVQVREPAELRVFDLDAAGRSRLVRVLDLSAVSVLHTGHQVFHQSAGLGVACASCHGEGTEDAHVWMFEGIGPRRTQSLLAGVTASAPFHWDGDMSDLSQLMAEVFVNRMGADAISPDWTAALAHFLDGLPERVYEAAPPSEASQRGAAVFESAGCASCHAGPRLGRAGAFDVGTGGVFQVPSLIGVAERLPLMHDGCAASLEARFDPACGGAAHGSADDLSPAELADLVAYLATL